MNAYVCNGVDGKDGKDGKDGVGGVRADGPCFDSSNRYVDCGNGTVTDTVTGLIWLKQADCLSIANWAAANQAAAGLKHGDCAGGLTDGSSPGDWRLPTKAEWEATIALAVEQSCYTPSVTNDAGTGCYGDPTWPSSFAGVASDNYWSSTSNKSHAYGAWDADVANGAVIDDVKYLTMRVWPVRGGR